MGRRPRLATIAADLALSEVSRVGRRVVRGRFLQYETLMSCELLPPNGMVSWRPSNSYVFFCGLGFGDSWQCYTYPGLGVAAGRKLVTSIGATEPEQKLKLNPERAPSPPFAADSCVGCCLWVGRVLGNALRTRGSRRTRANVAA